MVVGRSVRFGSMECLGKGGLVCLVCAVLASYVDGGVTANVGSAAAVGGVGVLVVVEVDVEAGGDVSAGEN